MPVCKQAEAREAQVVDSDLQVSQLCSGASRPAVCSGKRPGTSQLPCMFGPHRVRKACKLALSLQLQAWQRRTDI